MGFSSATLMNLAIPPHNAVLSGKDANLKHQMPKPLVQLKSKSNHEPPRLKLSRRDAMICFTTSVATTLLPMNPANARILNADIIQQFMDKFREMAGISKPKAEGEKKKPPVPLNDQPKDKNEKSNEKAANSKLEPKEAEKPQEKAENSKPKVDVSKGDEKPAAPENSPSTEKPVEAKNPKPKIL